MAVIHQQLLPSPTTPPRARIFCGLSKNAQNPWWHQHFPPRESGDLLFAQEEDFTMSTVLPAGFENCFGVFFLRAKFLLEITNLTWLFCSNRTNDQLLNYYSKDPVCCSKDVLDWCWFAQNGFFLKGFVSQGFCLPWKKDAVVPPLLWEALVGVSVCPWDEL